MIKNNPCPKCGYTDNICTQIGGFSNWDDYGIYQLDCGNDECKNTWTFEQEE